MAEKQDIAGVIAPPPLIYLAFLALGLVIHWLMPVSFLPSTINWIVAAPLIVVGLGFGGTAVVLMLRCGTSPDPGEPTKCLVVDGPFRLTRNPIYFSFVLIYLGITAAFNALAALVLLPAALAVIDQGVIAREERYLERKFGEEYLDYKRRVRRWL
jgi:protein-S-isoprenylcysteine O-methyltransferase Ste14